MTFTPGRAQITAGRPLPAQGRTARLLQLYGACGLELILQDRAVEDLVGFLQH